MQNENVEPLIPGEELELGFEFDHEQRIEDITVVFVHVHNPEERIVLNSDPHIVDDTLRTRTGGRAYRSEVQFYYRIEAGWTPGDYKFGSIEFRTSGGSLISIPDESNPLSGLTYVLGAEPESKPFIRKLIPT